MSGVNKAILVGRLGADPEFKTLESGVAVASISLATSEVYKDKDTKERKEQTEWHRVTLWRGLADIANQYLKKGDMVYIEGKLRTRKYGEEGNVKYSTEIVCDNMTMLSGSGGGNKVTDTITEEDAPPEKSDKLPF